MGNDIKHAKGKAQLGTRELGFFESFFKEDVPYTAKYLYDNKMKPGLAQLTAGLLKSAIDMLLLKQTGTTSTPSDVAKGATPEFRKWIDDEKEREKGVAFKPNNDGVAGSMYRFDYIWYNEYVEAAELKKLMLEAFRVSSNQLSVNHMYDIANCPRNNPSDTKYGWKNLTEANIRIVYDDKKDRYFVEPPKAVPL